MKDIMPLWWSYFWRSTLYVFSSLIIFLAAYWCAADLIIGPGGHKYMFQNKDTTLQIGTIVGTLSTIPAFVQVLRKRLYFLHTKDILTNQRQTISIKDALPLWWGFFWRNWLYAFAGWLVLALVIRGVSVISDLSIDEYFVQHPHIGKHIDAGLWIMASIPALSSTLNKWKPLPEAKPEPSADPFVPKQ